MADEVVVEEEELNVLPSVSEDDTGAVPLPPYSRIERILLSLSSGSSDSTPDAET